MVSDGSVPSAAASMAPTTGCGPGASAIDVLQQHVMAPVPELPVHQLGYQPLLERLMSKSREQRIPSCDELLTALEEMSHAMSDSGMIDPETLVSAGAVP